MFTGGDFKSIEGKCVSTLMVAARHGFMVTSESLRDEHAGKETIHHRTDRNTVHVYTGDVEK